MRIVKIALQPFGYHIYYTDGDFQLRHHHARDLAAAQRWADQKFPLTGHQQKVCTNSHLTLQK